MDIEERVIVQLWENLLDNRNRLIQLFERVSPQLLLRNENYQIVIKADQGPSGEHAGRFNATTVDDVADVTVHDPVDS